jgi:hypothetical protein
MSVNYVGVALVLLMAMVCYRAWRDSAAFQLKCVISRVDGNEYCVRERSKLAQAADRLASVNAKMRDVVSHCAHKYPDKDNVRRLVKGYNPDEVYETLPTSKYTAYSENKGEKLAFCLSTEKEGGELIDENTLAFVALHELAHIATASTGHTQEFWRNFKFILEEAVDIGVYVPVDYKQHNRRYCGTAITDNPLYDS